MKVLVQDIAKRANVSSGTVSNALNNRKGISDDKREYILKIAHEMGYFKKSNKENKVLRFVILSKQAHVVGDTPFFSELIRGIEMESSQLGFELLISHVSVDEQRRLAIDEVLKQDLVDGIALLGTEMDEHDLAMFSQLNIPIVVVDTVFKDQSFDFVAINNVDGTYDIVKHLIHCGHTSIGLINSSYQINNFRERKLGYMQALSDHNLMILPEHEALVEPSLEGAYQDMKLYLDAYLKENKKEQLPTAFFAVNDNIALGVMKAFEEHQLAVSIVGFDDLPLCDFCNPPLTTVRVDKQYLGRMAIQRLVQKINANDIGIQKVLIGTKIVERKSVKDIR